MKGNKIFDFSRVGFQQIINTMTKKINECVDAANNMIPRLDEYISKIDWNNIVNSELYQRVLGDLNTTNYKVTSLDNDKASKLELDVERKRIDSFTSLPSGTTNGDAELIDARIGYDGIVYDNVGGASRGQFDKTFKNLSAIENVLGFTRIKEFFKGEGYRISNGKAVADNNYCILQYKLENCDYVYLKAFAKSEVKFQFQSGSDYSSIIGSPFTGQYNGFIEVPSGANRLMINIEKTDNVSGLYTKGTDKINVNSLCSTDEFLNSLLWVEGKALNINGIAVDVANCSYTPMYIPISDMLKRTTIKNLYDKNSWTVAGLCFYDNMNKFIGFYKPPKEGEFSVKIEDIILSYPNAYYIRMTKLKDKQVYFDKANVTLKDNAYKLNMFKNVFIGGDSVTEGFIVDENIYQVEPQYSYPTQLGKIVSDWNITVKAKSGASPTSWRNMFYSSTDFSQYDLIIMELGYNGSDYGYFNMDDINTPGRNTYEYKKLIADIRSQNANAEIILVLSSDYKDTWDKWDWKPILELVASESNCKIINLRDKTYLDLGSDKYHGKHDGKMDYVHGNRKFYNAKAFVISKLIADVLE